MKIGKLIVISAIAAASVAGNFAVADTVDLGALTSYNDGHQFGGAQTSVPTGAFDNTYTFTLNPAATFDALVSGWWGLNNAGFSATLNGTPLSFSANGANYYLSLNNVTGSSSYSLHVTGSAFADSGYNVALTSVSAVPEPATFAMLLVGLGLVGTIARRRSKANLA